MVNCIPDSRLAGGALPPGVGACNNRRLLADLMRYRQEKGYDCQPRRAISTPGRRESARLCAEIAGTGLGG